MEPKVTESNAEIGIYLYYNVGDIPTYITTMKGLNKVFVVAQMQSILSLCLVLNGVKISISFRSWKMCQALLKHYLL